MQKERVLAYWFFESPVYGHNREVLSAPDSVIKLRDDLNKIWLNYLFKNRRIIPVVKLSPVFSEEPNGWILQLALRFKQNTVTNNMAQLNN